jgi:hypothetical protein
VRFEKETTHRILRVPTKEPKEDPMSQRKVYGLYKEIVKKLPLKKWQGLCLAALSTGIAEARSCWLSMAAERLGVLGKADSLTRRFQRFLNNPRVEVEACCAAWVGWVISNWRSDTVILLVDETKLANHLSMMMVGLAYRGRCVPLAWCCYPQDAWPMSQVDLIDHLLGIVAAGLPMGWIPLVEADRGIGTSPELVRRVAARGWHFLFRVQSQTRFLSADGQVCAVSHLARRGKSFSACGKVFKDAGWLDAYVHVIWRKRFAQPWCLITNSPTVHGSSYALRAWQEHSFRDLKSGGLHWNRSRVWNPDHANRLMLAIALAYAWLLSLGTAVIRAGRASRSALTRGSDRRFSVFRLGLRHFSGWLSRLRPSFFRLTFVPAFPFG